LQAGNFCSWKIDGLCLGLKDKKCFAICLNWDLWDLWDYEDERWKLKQHEERKFFLFYKSFGDSEIML
jgi:hypothetical protein